MGRSRPGGNAGGATWPATPSRRDDASRAAAAVVGIAGDRWIEAVTAAIGVLDGASLAWETVRNHVKGRLAGREVPGCAGFAAGLKRTTA